MTSTSRSGSVLKDYDLAERWDAIEEREQKIESMLGARRKGRLPTVRPAASLIKDLQAEHFVTSAELRELATRTYSQPVISVYLNLTPVPDHRCRSAGGCIRARNKTAANWQRQIELVLREHRPPEEEAALSRLADYLGSGLVRRGLGPVLEVVNEFLVRRLLVSIELTQPGFVCRQHHFLSLEGGRCPFCGTDLLPAENIIDELIEFARLHGVGLMVIEERPELLDLHAGVAAVTYDLRAA